MKLNDYLKSRMTAYLFYLCGAVLSWLFMVAFKADPALIRTVLLLGFAAVAAAELTEFLRRRRFFDRLLTQLEALDQKYLIQEMIAEPDFIEGKLLCEILRETDRSMCEHVAEYRRSAHDFREFIELWVHEVKLPVAALLLMCRNHRDLSEKAYEQLRRIDLYTDQVLYYARSENAEKDYSISELPLKKAVSAAAMRFKDDLLLRGVTLHVDCGAVIVHSDSKWLEYILGQLFANSLKYFDPARAPEISITAEEHADHALLRFRDNGIGIPQQDLANVFEKSFTGENGRTHAKSTGIGLYLVRSLCTKLGHEVTVDSVRGAYTEFTLRFQKNLYFEM